jgi:hypothetical protein
MTAIGQTTATLNVCHDMVDMTIATDTAPASRMVMAMPWSDGLTRT